MRRLVEVDELAEILVDGHQDAILLGSDAQALTISRIFTEEPSFKDIVACFVQPLGESPAGAAIDRKLHAPAMRTASSDSFAMAALAYSMQAPMSSGSRSG